MKPSVPLSHLDHSAARKGSEDAARGADDPGRRAITGAPTDRLSRRHRRT
ncbi:hypothetical protein [Paragemmobacter ruber]|uniref:Uncharacterized protein n=1 Tax=Paragemmobacter ruber TaxID=1985673 RepID=A0ABW9Y3U1_9RHOB|nr:hypothetical protein [Rhodobacter ruber]NBE07163.1 hypothetical protein [Rhodobacter ruber]